MELKLVLFHGAHHTRPTPQRTYYAVARGREVGVFSDWESVRNLVCGYRGALWKEYVLPGCARKFVENNRVKRFWGSHAPAPASSVPSGRPVHPYSATSPLKLLEWKYIVYRQRLLELQSDPKVTRIHPPGEISHSQAQRPTYEVTLRYNPNSLTRRSLPSSPLEEIPCDIPVLEGKPVFVDEPNYLPGLAETRVEESAISSLLAIRPWTPTVTDVYVGGYVKNTKSTTIYGIGFYYGLDDARNCTSGQVVLRSSPLLGLKHGRAEIFALHQLILEVLEGAVLGWATTPVRILTTTNKIASLFSLRSPAHEAPEYVDAKRITHCLMPMIGEINKLYAKRGWSPLTIEYSDTTAKARELAFAGAQHVFANTILKRKPKTRREICH